jgi:ATP-dependent Clp protease ATP-binding subunit ClpX
MVTSDDILEFGLIPELVGRLPVISALTPLDESGLMRVLTEPRNALVRQYQSLFNMENCELKFTDEAMRAIAKRALEKGTGARGLRSIVEEIMLDLMFELPDLPKGGKFVVDESMVNSGSAVFSMPESKSA